MKQEHAADQESMNGAFETMRASQQVSESQIRQEMKAFKGEVTEKDEIIKNLRSMIETGKAETDESTIKDIKEFDSKHMQKPKEVRL